MTQRLATVLQEAAETLAAFSIPLYYDDKRRPSFLGTAFFVNVPEGIFLASAAHVLDNADKVPVYYFTNEKQRRFLTGSVVRSKIYTSREEDRIDVAVVRIDEPNGPPYLNVSKYALDTSYLKPRRTPREGGHYAILGYPQSKNGFDVVSRSVPAAPYCYRSDSAPDADYSQHGVSPDTHIVLPIDIKNTFVADGSRVRFPSPVGMSGSPIFEMFRENGDQSRVFPVVGVGIEYRRKTGVVIGTDIAYVIDAIRHAAEQTHAASGSR